ncbi:hypothetical protein HR12_33870 [Microbacterium sp. SUBG005]|nr:hypothetical protein HR12_33870 [Microbacterium sp. SUBG005]
MNGISGATAIAVGPASSFAVVQGAVYSWGDNTDGILGDGTTTARPAPVAVTGITSGATDIAASSTNAYAIVNGAVTAWGGAGRLGNGSTSGSTTRWP